jgi:hypothetical protein
MKVYIALFSLLFVFGASYVEAECTWILWWKVTTGHILGGTRDTQGVKKKTYYGEWKASASFETMKYCKEDMYDAYKNFRNSGLKLVPENACFVNNKMSFVI